MQLVKLITPKRIKTLHCLSGSQKGFSLTVLILLFTAFQPVFSQDNSPYSRYGIGDLVPPTQVTSRGLGGISAGYTDFLSINFSNPASYSSFQAVLEAKSKKLISGAKLAVVIVECRHVKPLKGDKLGRVTYHHPREMLITV